MVGLPLTHPTNRRPPEACHTLAAFIYAAIKITVLLLAAGTFLGAWADKAWGHFWSWDSKEVWALVSLLVYAFFLHLRCLGWLRDFGMVLTAVLGFTAILFTYYGVNFVLGTGMHSYGSGGRWTLGRDDGRGVRVAVSCSRGRTILGRERSRSSTNEGTTDEHG